MKRLFWKNVFINQFIMIGVAYAASCIKLDTRFDQSFPTVFEISWQILVFGVIEDVLFYFSHRLLHTPYFYGKVHKVHHIYNITGKFILNSMKSILVSRICSSFRIYIRESNSSNCWSNFVRNIDSYDYSSCICWIGYSQNAI